jgi:hypothetical protein
MLNAFPPSIGKAIAAETRLSRQLVNLVLHYTSYDDVATERILLADGRETDIATLFRAASLLPSCRVALSTPIGANKSNRCWECPVHLVFRQTSVLLEGTGRICIGLRRDRLGAQLFELEQCFNRSFFPQRVQLLHDASKEHDIGDLFLLPWYVGKGEHTAFLLADSALKQPNPRELLCVDPLSAELGWVRVLTLIVQLSIVFAAPSSSAALNALPRLTVYAVEG